MGPWDYILSSLDVKDLGVLAAVNRNMQKVVNYFSRRAFTLEKILDKYFQHHEIQQFQTMQERTGTVISGSSAVQFFHRSIWPESDLDLYVEEPFAAECGRFVIECGYTPGSRSIMKNGSEDSDYGLKSIHSIMDFTKGSLKVQVIATESSVMKTILGFHSSESEYRLNLHC
jgi:hypothetical protein